MSLKRGWSNRKITPVMNGKATKTSKKLKMYKIKVILLVAVALYTVLALSKAWETCTYVAPVAQLEVTEELSMQDWVLQAVKEAEIDEYKAYNIIHCESRWNPEARLINKDRHQSVDRGLWQINSRWHPEVSNHCAYDYKCATIEAIRIINERGFEEWTCGK